MRIWKSAVVILVAALVAPADGAAQSTAYTAEALTLSRAPGDLAGTLLLPQVTGPVPIVLLIAGSGPTDRDGNGGGLKSASLRQLAESLAVRQVATLRYDKRGVGGSISASLPERDLRFETLADDVGAWVARLASDKRFARVIVAGHSEGALLGLLALKDGRAAAYVSLAGPARPIHEVLHDQLAAQLPPALLAQADTVLVQLRAGRTVVSTPLGLDALFRQSVQPYLISWMQYAGQSELASVRVPCLIVQGSNDFQVEPREGEMLAKANPRCTLARIDGMNHVLKAAPADRTAQTPTYLTPDAPLAPGLIDAIVTFVSSLKESMQRFSRTGR